MQDVLFSPRLVDVERQFDSMMAEVHDASASALEFDNMAHSHTDLDLFEFPGDDEASMWTFVDGIPEGSAQAQEAIDAMAAFIPMDDVGAAAPMATESVSVLPPSPRRRKRKTMDAVMDSVPTVAAVPTTSSSSSTSGRTVVVNAEFGPAPELAPKKARQDRATVASTSTTSATVTSTSSSTSPSAAAPRGSRGGPGPQRCVPWRKPGTVENARMRGAVWTYRFAPGVRSKEVQKAFGVSVKSMMRYVYDSCQPEFANYGLFFGAAGMGPAGRADRALKRTEGRVSARSIGYFVDPNAAGVPELARQFLMLRASRATQGGGGSK